MGKGDNRRTNNSRQSRRQKNYKERMRRKMDPKRLEAVRAKG